jgi:hypothetical protein
MTPSRPRPGVAISLVGLAFLFGGLTPSQALAQRHGVRIYPTTQQAQQIYQVQQLQQMQLQRQVQPLLSQLAQSQAQINSANANFQQRLNALQARIARADGRERANLVIQLRSLEQTRLATLSLLVQSQSSIVAQLRNLGYRI